MGNSRVRLRKPLREFAEEMERRLRANDHKNGWECCSRSYLRGRLLDELGELMDALEANDGRAVTHEAADVANFAMMLASTEAADVEGGGEDD